MNYGNRINTLLTIFGEEYLGQLFRHLEHSYDAIFRLEGGQLDYFMEHMNNEGKRTDRFSTHTTLANDTLGYDAIRVLAILTHPCQQCAEDISAWHTRPAFCNHKETRSGENYYCDCREKEVHLNGDPFCSKCHRPILTKQS